MATSVALQRLARTFLLDTAFTSGRDVVRALGAVQAQDYEGAKWAIAQRAVSLTDAALEREIDSGAILRTHVLRPTWHFVDPTEIRWMLALTAPRIKQAMASYDRKMGLTPDVYRRTEKALIKALRDHNYMTRAELKAILGETRVGPLGTQRAAHLMMRPELDAVICSGPRRGKQFTYALLDERAPAVPEISRDEALLALARRYFRTRSPATAHDFAWWSGLAMADVRRAIALAGSELESLTIDDRPYWISGDPSARAPRSAHMLPNYDEFFIGFRDRSAIGQRMASVHHVTGGSTAISHVIVIDGQLVGTWRRTVSDGRVSIAVNLAVPLSPTERRRVEKEIRRYQTFLGSEIGVTGFQKTAKRVSSAGRAKRR